MIESVIEVDPSWTVELYRSPIGYVVAERDSPTPIHCDWQSVVLSASLLNRLQTDPPHQTDSHMHVYFYPMKTKNVHVGSIVRLGGVK